MNKKLCEGTLQRPDEGSGTGTLNDGNGNATCYISSRLIRRYNIQGGTFVSGTGPRHSDSIEHIRSLNQEPVPRMPSMAEIMGGADPYLATTPAPPVFQTTEDVVEDTEESAVEFFGDLEEEEVVVIAAEEPPLRQANRWAEWAAASSFATVGSGGTGAASLARAAQVASQSVTFDLEAGTISERLSADLVARTNESVMTSLYGGGAALPDSEGQDGEQETSFSPRPQRVESIREVNAASRLFNSFSSTN